jgi:hypothetical protein
MEWERSGLRCCVRCAFSAACWLEDAHGGCGISFQPGRGTYRPRDEIASAVRTGAAEARVCAITAKGALVGADHSFGRFGREVLVAALAAGAQLKHEHLTDLDRNPTHWAVSDVLVNPS